MGHAGGARVRVVVLHIRDRLSGAGVGGTGGVGRELLENDKGEKD